MTLLSPSCRSDSSSESEGGGAVDGGGGSVSPEAPQMSPGSEEGSPKVSEEVAPGKSSDVQTMEGIFGDAADLSSS